MTGYKAYQGNQVDGAGPLGLVLLSYEALYKSLALTRRAIEEDDMTAEADHTCRCIEAIVELSGNVNVEEGGEIASNLVALYAYMMKRLSENLCSKSTEPVDEVMKLVQTLREGWQQIQRDQQKKLSTVSHKPQIPNQSMVQSFANAA